jgi:hypothetical protein
MQQLIHSQVVCLYQHVPVGTHDFAAHSTLLLFEVDELIV